MNLKKMKDYNKLIVLLFLLSSCDNSTVISNKSEQYIDTTIQFNNKFIDTINYDSFDLILEEIINSKSIKNRKDLQLIFSPLKNDKFVHLKVGVNTEFRFVTIYNFYINRLNKEIWYMNFKDSLVLFNKDINLDR